MGIHDVVFLGCGNMGAALARGMAGAGVVDLDKLWLHDVTDAAQQLAAELGGQVGIPTSAHDAARETAVTWVVCVKPQHVAAVLNDAPIVAGDVVISVAAGVTRDVIRGDREAHVVRAMPNTPVTIGQGVTGLLADPPARAIAEQLFGAVGVTVHLDDESQFDALTAVSGCGPAFIFLVIEALADAGVDVGLPRELAVRLATNTALGASALAQHEDTHLAELRNRVTSPGGATSAGLVELERGALRSTLINAVRAAAVKSSKLGK